ncbi:MAG: hypothetical protein PF488_02685 [Patescibacteria group bacterium]|jgi:hypothetical protein|nr:hypothetical protein [Patescibacteria group bacterium]
MYVLRANGLSLPVKGSLGEHQVINRALNLLSDFSDIKIYKEQENGRLEILHSFLGIKEERRFSNFSLASVRYKKEYAG